MIFHPKKRRFIHPSGQTLTAADVRKHVDDQITEWQAEVDKEHQKLVLGLITLAAFFEFMRQGIQAWHGITGAIAYGGHDQMTPERWARIEEKVQSELTFLDGFQQAAEASYATAQTLADEAVTSIADQIPSGLETVVSERLAQALALAAPFEAETITRRVIADVLADSVDSAASIADSVTLGTASDLIGGTIGSRAQMYAESAFATYENNVASREQDEGAMGVRRVCEDDESSCDECPVLANEDYVPFSEITEIGDTICGSRCRCYFEFEYAGIEPLTIDRGIYATA